MLSVTSALGLDLCELGDGRAGLWTCICCPRRRAHPQSIGIRQSETEAFDDTTFRTRDGWQASAVAVGVVDVCGVIKFCASPLQRSRRNSIGRDQAAFGLAEAGLLDGGAETHGTGARLADIDFRKKVEGRPHFHSSTPVWTSAE